MSHFLGQVPGCADTIIIIIIIIIILLIYEIFTSALADSFPPESVWQQVFSSFQYYSQYFGRSQQCSSLAVFQSSSDFQVLQSLY